MKDAGRGSNRRSRRPPGSSIRSWCHGPGRASCPHPRWPNGTCARPGSPWRGSRRRVPFRRRASGTSGRTSCETSRFTEVTFGYARSSPREWHCLTDGASERVVAGLFLSRARPGGEGGCLFGVAEPFAHLSLDRVDDVGKFLRRSGSQFLITVPTPLDRGQLGPAPLLS